MSGEARGPGFIGGGTAGYWIPLTFAAAAAMFALKPLPFRNPAAPYAQLPAWVTDTTPVRKAKDRPEYRLAVFSYKCSDCHRIIPKSPEAQHVRVQHLEIQLQHGINSRCLNCHHPDDRDAFVDDFGKEIPWNEPWRVCGKCHGTVFRDWQHGAHGRTNGFWDKSRGPQTHLRCTQCHDPHNPAFAPLQPAPGPDTLRMGRQDFGPPSTGHDPLRLRDQAPAGRNRGD